MFILRAIALLQRLAAVEHNSMLCRPECVSRHTLLALRLALFSVPKLKIDLPVVLPAMIAKMYIALQSIHLE